MFLKKHLYIALFSVLNTVLLFLLTFYLWSVPWLAGDEKLMIWSTSAIKLLMRDKPESADYALINVSYDLELIDKFDEFGFPVGNEAITDRTKLARLFRIVQNYDPKPVYILCDIFFERPSGSDSLLSAALSQIDEVIVSSHLDDQLNLQEPVVTGAKSGLSDYVIGNIFEGVYKYQLYFGDSLKLTPLIMAEDVMGVSSRRWGPFVSLGESLTLNHFILNYQLLQKDIVDQEAGFNPINLGELLLLPDKDISNFLSEKIVVIGDFEKNDMHESVFEIISGPIILLNAFLNIMEGETYVNFWFFLMVGSFFMFLSYLAISPDDMIENYIKQKYSRFKWIKNLTGFMSYMILLVIFSILLFFAFNIHLNVFFLAVYLFVVDKLNKLVRRITA